MIRSGLWKRVERLEEQAGSKMDETILVVREADINSGKISPDVLENTRGTVIMIRPRTERVTEYAY